MLVFMVAPVALRAAAADERLDPTTMQEVFCRFPFAQVVPLDSLGAWGIMYADTYGKLHLLRATPKGWKLEWEVTNLGAKIRKFFVRDLDGNGIPEIIIATVDGRILVYSMETYQNIWQNLEDNFSSIEAIEVANVDDDPQLELVYLAEGHLYIVDGKTKSRQWVSQRTFTASEIIVGNVDKDPQMEIILNSGVIIDSRFYNVEVEWDRPFGDRIALYDMNNDGIPEVIGEFSDYSLRVYDVYARRELW
jgi:outer membrane protein assembly factor BamB